MATVTSGTILGMNSLTYLPTNYISTKSYPCMIFFPGAGEIGTNAALLQNHGPFQYLKQGVDLGLDLIVIAIQNVNQNPRPDEIASYVTAVKKLYNIGALIGTGLSRGGQDWEWFANNSEANLSQLSGLVLFSSQGTVADIPSIPGTYNPALFVKYNIKFWWGIGTMDSFYDNNKARYKALAALNPSLTAWTEWAGAGHGDPVWSDGYNPKWTNNTLKQSIYTWTAGFGSAVPINPPPVVATYKNAVATKVFTKNDCGLGTPSSVTYTVAAGTYTSTISQVDADAQAANDIATNGQIYANQNGTCTPVLIATIQVYSDGGIKKI